MERERALGIKWPKAEGINKKPLNVTHDSTNTFYFHPNLLMFMLNNTIMLLINMKMTTMVFKIINMKMMMMVMVRCQRVANQCHGIFEATHKPSSKPPL